MRFEVFRPRFIVQLISCLFVLTAAPVLCQMDSASDAGNSGSSAQYIENLQHGIKNAWIVPNMQFGGCACGFTIDQGGHLVNPRVVTPSGADPFDQAAMDAIRNAVQAGQVPEGLKGAFVSASFDVGGGDSSVVLDVQPKSKSGGEASITSTESPALPVVGPEQPGDMAKYKADLKHKPTGSNMSNQAANPNMGIPPLPGPIDPDAVKLFISDLKQNIEHNWTPKANLDGTTTSTVTIGPGGNFSKIKVMQSSGKRRFDDATSEAIVQADGAQKLPSGLTSLKLKVTFIKDSTSKNISITEM
jgi:TonB family protein